MIRVAANAVGFPVPCVAQITRRRQLVEMRKQEVTRLQQTTDYDSRSDIKGKRDADPLLPLLI